MFKTIFTIFSIADLRKRIFFTLGLIFVFRIGTHITIPGINFSVLDNYLAAQAGGTRGLLDYLDLFAGGAFNRLSIFALGIMPYISASIVMQLMIVVIPTLQKLQKEGELGRRKITQYTRYGTVFLCAIQAYGIAVYIRSISNAILSESNQYLIGGGYNVSFVIMTILVITTGTMVLVWLGELITERGIGNGISLLVFAGIISSAPSAAYSFWVDVQQNEQEIILLMILSVLFIIMIALSIYTNRRECEKSHYSMVKG